MKDLNSLLLDAEIFVMQGNNVEALKLLDDAERIANKDQRIEQLAAIYFKKGNVLSVMGSAEEARNNYQAALSVYEELLRADPENLKCQENVALTETNLGNMLKDMGRIEEAKNSYEAALTLRRGF